MRGSRRQIGARLSGAVLQIPGTISGPGKVIFGGGFNSSTGVVELTNSSANTYTGGSLIGTGILRISNPNQLGTGNLFLSGGTLQASANLTFASAPRLIASSAVDTLANNVTLSAGIGGPGGLDGTFATNVTLTKQGTGTLTIGGSSDFAGALTASAGRLLLSGTLSGISSITAAATASVELGASYRLNIATTVKLSGGTFATGGFSEDLGTFALSSNVLSTIDLGNGSSHLTLADSHTQTWSGTLSIQNWSGSAGGSGTDQIFFGTSSSGLTASQIANVTFLNPTGYAAGSYSAQLLSTGELVAIVPEPGSCALVLCGGMALAVRRRRERR